MLKSSRRALAVAACFALGLSVVGPAAHAGLLGGDDSTAVEGVGLPVGGALLGGDLLGGDLVGGLLGGESGLLGGLLGGGGLPVVGALGGGGLPLISDVLGGGGLPVVGALGGGGLPVVGDVLGGELLAGEMLNVVTDTTQHCGAAIPQLPWALLGDVTETVCAPFSYGISGLLSSL